MTRCESYPPCFGTIYFPTAPYEDILLICASKTRDFSREILDYTT